MRGYLKLTQYLIAELLQEYDNSIFVIERISLTQFHI